MKIIRSNKKNIKTDAEKKINIASGQLKKDALKYEGEDFWEILIVDDENDVHEVTEISLKNETFYNRKLKFIHSYNAEEAKQVLKENDNIAIAFIDVVMETDTAGLDLVKYIREELNNHHIRLIIRTGQPGIAPERHVIDNYDIDDYKDKTELLANKLYTAVRSALKSYRDLLDIERKNVFLGMASHDLRSPLSTIISICDFSLDFTEPNEEFAKTLYEIKNIAMYSFNMVADFLDVSMIESGKLKLEKDCVDLEKLVDDSVGINRISAETKNIKVEKIAMSSTELNHFFGDYNRLKQVISNIINNSIKYSEPGTAVKVIYKIDNDNLVVTVKDQGPGIPDKFKDRIFKAFGKTSNQPTGNETSTGLGLVICSRIIKAHSGKIWFENNNGENGVSFSFSIPAFTVS